MAKIVIDCRMWGESGIGRYIRNLVSNLQKLDVENKYFLILLEKDFKNANLKNNFHKILGDFGWYGIKEQIVLLKILNSIKPDLVHFPHFNIPVFYRGKFVVTIHDLIHQHFQMRRATTRDPITYRIKSFGYKTVFKSALLKSSKIIVPSNYVKNLLINEWRVWDKKIVVTPEGVDGEILKLNQESRIKNQEVLKKYKIKSKYILYVGNAHPHKNVEGLIKAFLKLKEKKENKDLQLVLTGNKHYFWDKIKEKYGLKDIIYTGFVSDGELVTLYKNAKVFVQPSFEEGFGIPILEAFAASTPVVSSNAGSLMEVGGSAVSYFDPKNIDDMVQKIQNVLSDNNFASELVKKGKIRVKDFSWEKLAKQTLKVYKEFI